jgi:hypothetical protein
MSGQKSESKVKPSPRKPWWVIPDNPRERYRWRLDAPIAKRGRPRKGQTYSVFPGDPDEFLV